MSTVSSAGRRLWLSLFLAAWQASAQDLSPTDEALLNAAAQGSVVLLRDLAARPSALPRVPLTLTPESSPQFLLSDQPEYFLTGDGIALQEDVKPGVVRLYLYHVPEPTGARKTITAVLENLGSAPLNFRFLRRGCPAPGGDYGGIARQAMVAFLKSQPESELRRVAPGGRAPLDEALEKVVVTKDQLVHGFYEIEIDQPARVSVLQRATNVTSRGVLDSLPRLPRRLPGSERGNGAGRGLFLAPDRAGTNGPGFVLDSTNGLMQIVLADGRSDPWIVGHDRLEDHAEVRNVGNYGVFYRLRLTRRTSDGRGLALLLCQTFSNTHGCGSLSAAVKVSGGVWPAGIVELPAPGRTLQKAGEMALIQKFPPLAPGQTECIELLYSPPGAACLPTPLVLVPYRP